jgi:hypothetical protein
MKNETNKITKISTINYGRNYLQGEGTININNEMTIEWNTVCIRTEKKTKVLEVTEELEWHLRILTDSFKKYCNNNNVILYSY